MRVNQKLCKSKSGGDKDSERWGCNLLLSQKILLDAGIPELKERPRTISLGGYSAHSPFVVDFPAVDISQGGLAQILSQRRESKSKSLMQQGKCSSLPGPGKQGSALQVSGKVTWRSWREKCQPTFLGCRKGLNSRTITGATTRTFEHRMPPSQTPNSPFLSCVFFF